MHNLLFLFHHVIKRVSVLGKQDDYWNKWQNQRLSRKYPLSFGWCWTKCTKSICDHMSRTCCCVPRASSFTNWVIWKIAAHNEKLRYAHNRCILSKYSIKFHWLFNLPSPLFPVRPCRSNPVECFEESSSEVGWTEFGMFAACNDSVVQPCKYDTLFFYNIINVIPVIWYMVKYHSLPLTVILEPRLPTRWLFWIHQVNGKFISICKCLYIEIWMKFIKYYMTWCKDRCQDFKDFMSESGLWKLSHGLSKAL